jgi:hypothetical protein
LINVELLLKVVWRLTPHRTHGLDYQEPKLTNIASQVSAIGKRYDEERERTALLQKAKELLTSN